MAGSSASEEEEVMVGTGRGCGGEGAKRETNSLKSYLLGLRSRSTNNQRRQQAERGECLKREKERGTKEAPRVTATVVAAQQQAGRCQSWCSAVQLQQQDKASGETGGMDGCVWTSVVDNGGVDQGGLGGVSGCRNLEAVPTGTVLYIWYFVRYLCCCSHTIRRAFSTPDNHQTKQPQQLTHARPLSHPIAQNERIRRFGRLSVAEFGWAWAGV